MMLTQKRMKELLTYDRETGVITRTKTISGNAVKGMVAGSIKPNGYMQIQVDGKCYLGHRLAWLHEYGEFPSGFLDHINGKRDDNRIENLRIVTPSQNCHNENMRTNNTSGIKGVTWDKRRNTWSAKLWHERRCINLGSFKDINLAKEAIMKKRRELHGEYANDGLVKAFPEQKFADQLRKGGNQ
ncbi:HNH endonuclease [Escherichia coli]|uniref:HNH endonuclease n=1 Tax=Escherichia coli TaxID=562 RepID=UPI000DDABA64|nr:HNH endonuclease [Escherichia coli]